MKKLNLKKTGLVAGTLCLMMTVGGVMAFFTDKEEKINAFTVGQVQIQLKEDEWDKKPDGNKDGVPDEAEALVPGKTLTKDPKINNFGTNDAFVFATVEVPCKELITVNENGTKNPLGMTELFTYKTNPSWKALGTCTITAPDGKVSKKHLYAYANEQGVCQPVKAKQETVPVFDHVTFVNAMEGQGLENQPLDVKVTAYAIQAEHLPADTKDATTVWEMISNQKDITDQYTP